MADPSAQHGKVPVTMLSGFLGAGKTTLLRYLLENNKSIKVGCVVNDVAGVNVDAKLIRNDRNRDRDNQNNTTSDLADTVELANGCACCSIQDELFSSFEQLISLADKKGSAYDRLVLENSGVAEPHNIRELFAEAEAAGHPLLQRIELDTMVTVVDSATFISDYSSRTPAVARPDLGEGGNLRPVVDLLVEQIECADFVILNKIDMLDGTNLDSLAAIITSLNPLAKVFGKDAKGLVAHLNIEGQHRGAVAAARAAEDHSHSHHGHASEKENSHGHTSTDDHEHHHHAHVPGHDHHHKEGQAHRHHVHSHDRQETTAAARFGIKSFVYSRRLPFHPQRLKELVLRWLPVAKNHAIDTAPETGDSPIKTVLRSKGFMWMSNSHATAFYWSHAGQHFEIRDEGDWWAAVPDEEWPTHPAQRDVIVNDFDMATDMGDRRQEIVFIGANMDQAAISQQLDGALLTQEEMARYCTNYAAQQDPPHAAMEHLQKKAKTSPQ